jgi:succinoglycan biosynthesis protein ExoA
MKESRPINLTIIAVTHNRPELFKLCIESLLTAANFSMNSSPINFEILVGLNGANNETERVLENFVNLEKNQKILTQKFDQRLTPSTARNLLVQKAIGDWVYFIDDDASISSNFFEAFVRIKELNPEVSAFGGPNLTPPHSSSFQNASGEVLASRFATYFSAARYKSTGSTRYCSEEALILCNLFVKKEVLELNPFPNTFQCCEENWMLQNLKSKGLKLAYCPELVVWHERRTNILLFIKQVFRYGFGRGQILRRRPSGVRPTHLIPSMSLLYALNFLALAFFIKLSVWSMIPFFTYFLFALIAATIELPTTKKALIGLIYRYGLFPVIHASYGWGLLVGLLHG